MATTMENILYDNWVDAKIRMRNLEATTQALADELMAQDDILDNVIIEYARALDTLENYEDPMTWEQHGV